MKSVRPKLTNEEDELMKMQEDFIEGKLQTSVTDIVRTPQSSGTDGSKGKSVFARKRELSAKVKSEPMQYEIPKINVLKDIVEKIELPGPIVSRTREHAFPEVFQREKTVQSTGNTSIFAQHLKKAKYSEEDTKLPTVKIPSYEASCSSITKAALGEMEATKIHQENIQKLSSMTEEEILKEQQQLLQNLDPKLISFLKKKKQTVVNKQEMVGQSASQDEEPKCDVEEIRELANSNWVHMDHVEKEKVRWMSPLPSVKEIPGKSFQARFDFQGCLLAASVDLPVTSALYHHGEEPERAGYSINELMMLSRSSKQQQRVVALNTMDKVLENARLGIYDAYFESPLIPTLIDNGLLVLLRFCLDDNTPAVVSAALCAFSRLISSPFDETCLERCLAWFRGEEQPNLCSRVHMDSTDQEQEVEMNDTELVRIDVIKACLRMDVPLRIRYILEEIRPEARAVIAALEILTRIARHSASVAQSILDCPRLLKSIFRFFLPSDWRSLSQNDSRVDNVYGLPVRQVLRLVRVIATWNAELASKLVAKYPLLESIKIYMAVETAELKLPTQEALLLVLDCYFTWRTLLRQGVGIQSFLDFYPVWFQQLLYFQSSVSMDGANNRSNLRFSHQVGSSLLLLMESLLSICCRPDNYQHLHVMQVGGLREVTEMCIAKWAWQLRQLSGPIPESAACILAAGINLLATFYQHWKDPQAFSMLHELCSSHILPLLHSKQVEDLVGNMSRHSNLASSLQSFQRYSDSLPSVEATALGGELMPVLGSSSPFPFLTSIFRILRIWKKTNVSSEVLELRLSNDYFIYLSNLNGSASSLSGNWFTRYEISFLHEFFMCCVDWNTLTPPQMKTIHEAALSALTSIPSGAEALAAEWLHRLIFQKDFVQFRDELESGLERLKLTESSLPNSTNLKPIDALDQIATCYTKIVLPSAKDSPSMLTLEPRQILPVDWIYLPVVTLYQKNLEKQNTTEKDVLEIALSTLQALYMLLLCQPKWFYHIQPAEHYARLACIFLATNDIFLDENVNVYMWPILRALASQQLDFTKPISGVDDFKELYGRLVEQYEAVSYGSSLFSAFLLLPLEQTQPSAYRFKLWCEHPDALRIFALKETEILAPIDNWLNPNEVDVVLLMKYAAAIRTKIITSQRNPVLFQIASHHIEKYLGKNPIASDQLSVVGCPYVSKT